MVSLKCKLRLFSLLKHGEKVDKLQNLAHVHITMQETKKEEEEEEEEE